MGRARQPAGVMRAGSGCGGDTCPSCRVVAQVETEKVGFAKHWSSVANHLAMSPTLPAAGACRQPGAPPRRRPEAQCHGSAATEGVTASRPLRLSWPQLAVHLLLRHSPPDSLPSPCCEASCLAPTLARRSYSTEHSSQTNSVCLYAPPPRVFSLPFVLVAPYFSSITGATSAQQASWRTANAGRDWGCCTAAVPSCRTPATQAPHSCHPLACLLLLCE